MKILVVGATGTLGRHVVAKLLAKGVLVRALSRSAERAASLAASGAEIVVGDLIDPDSLRRACTDVDRILASAHGLLGQGRYRSEHVDGAGHLSLLAAARDAGVKRFVYVSARGASPRHPVDFFRTKYAIEVALAASGLDSVVLRPTAFMEQHVHAFNGARFLAEGCSQLIGPGTKRRNFVASEDVAEVAVRALLDEKPFRTIEIGGPGNYSNRDVMELYARIAGLKPRAKHLPVGVARLLSLATAFVNPGRARILKLMSLNDDAHPEQFFESAQLERTYDLRMTTVETFVQACIERYLQSSSG